MMLRGADSDASALVSADEFRADSASRPAERGDASGRAVKRMPSQCVFRRRARPRARPADGAILRRARFFRFFFLPPKFRRPHWVSVSKLCRIGSYGQTVRAVRENDASVRSAGIRTQKFANWTAVNIDRKIHG